MNHSFFHTTLECLVGLDFVIELESSRFKPHQALDRA